MNISHRKSIVFHTTRYLKIQSDEIHIVVRLCWDWFSYFLLNILFFRSTKFSSFLYNCDFLCWLLVYSPSFVLLMDRRDCMFCSNGHLYMVISPGSVSSFHSNCHICWQFAVVTVRTVIFSRNVNVDLQFPVLYTEVAFFYQRQRTDIYKISDIA